MPYMDWDDSLSVGVAEIDAQHKKLIEMINDLHDLKGDSEEAAHALANYTAYHFITEEKYMDQVQYEGYEAHVEQHMKCSLKAMEFLGDALEGEDVGERLCSFLKIWLKGHIMGTDMKLGAFLSRQGVV